MDADQIREVAIEELHAAFIRFLARAGEDIGTHEVFAWTVALWLQDWTASYLLPEPPADPDVERELLDEVARARADLELRDPDAA